VLWSGGGFGDSNAKYIFHSINLHSLAVVPRTRTDVSFSLPTSTGTINQVSYSLINEIIMHSIPLQQVSLCSTYLNQRQFGANCVDMYGDSQFALSGSHELPGAFACTSTYFQRLVQLEFHFLHDSIYTGQQVLCGHNIGTKVITTCTCSTPGRDGSQERYTEGRYTEGLLLGRCCT
jgi:hypothetical protein